MDKRKLAEFCKIIDYKFIDISLLDLALTHPSTSTGANNQRLEFLGDAVLNFCMAATLYKEFPNAKEGELSRLRSQLVSGRTLVKVAQQLGMSEYLQMSRYELQEKGNHRTSALEDAFEALLGAIYLDSGVQSCHTVIIKLFTPLFNSLQSGDALKDFKSRLQEHLQSLGKPLPIYEVVEISGKAHDLTFRISCKIVDSNIEAISTAKTRKIAEQKAAELVLSKILPKSE
ncbi:MAG: ribonuclease III [Thiotrichales bacterium]|nr:MAG: ribonuclease III [Thiotrichales bacterium]